MVADLARIDRKVGAGRPIFGAGLRDVLRDVSSRVPVNHTRFSREAGLVVAR